MGSLNRCVHRVIGSCLRIHHKIEGRRRVIAVGTHRGKDVPGAHAVVVVVLRVRRAGAVGERLAGKGTSVPAFIAERKMNIAEDAGPGILLTQSRAPRAIGRARRAGEKLDQIRRVRRGEGHWNLQIGLRVQQLADDKIVLERETHRSRSARPDKISRTAAGRRMSVIGLGPIAHALPVLVHPVAKHAGIAADRRAIVVLQRLNDLIAQNRRVAGLGVGLLEADIVEINRARRGVEHHLGYARRCGALRFRGRAVKGVLRPARGQFRGVGAATESPRR